MTLLFTMLFAFVTGGIVAMCFLITLSRNLHMFFGRQQSGIWLITGALMRISIVLAILLFILQISDWRHLMMSLGGFILVRCLYLQYLLNSYKVSTKPGIRQ